MRCPICNREIEVGGNPFRPFCSERCKMIDLDNWLSDRYRVPASRDSAPGESGPSRAAGGSEADDD